MADETDTIKKVAANMEEQAEDERDNAFVSAMEAELAKIKARVDAIEEKLANPYKASIIR